MSLDSALRSHLVAGGEAIRVDADEGLRAVRGAVKRRRRRAGLAAACVAVACAAVVVWADVSEVRRPGPPPARENDDRPPGPDVDRRKSLPGPNREGAAPQRAPRGRVPAAAADAGARGPRPERRPGRHETRPRVPGAGDAAEVSLPDARTVVTGYEYGEVMGTHVGENAGLGCWDGEGATGANDCFIFEIGDGETRLDVVLVDDRGRRVHAVLYQYRPGEEDSDDLGPVCGRTRSPFVVTPGATVSLYIGSDAGCSPHAPTTGELRLRFWGA